MPRMTENWIALDTETTGFKPTDACVWSLAAVALLDGENIGEFDSLVRPELEFFQRQHRDVVRNVSGLGDAQLLELLDAPPASIVTGNFLTWLHDLAAARTVRFTSYNVAFDRPFLDVGPLRIAEAVETRLCRSTTWADCVMERSKQAMGLPRWPKLPVACAHFGIPFVESHQALADTRAAAALAIKLGMSTPVVTAPTLALEF